MKVHEYIKKLREEKGLTQRRLAQLSGISNTEISRIEKGERQQPSPVTLKKIAPHLGVSYTDLMVLAGYLPIEQGQKNMVVKEPETHYMSSSDSFDDFHERFQELYMERPLWELSYIQFMTGIPESQLEGFLDGTQKPTLEQVVKLADLYDVPVDWLIGRRKERVSPEDGPVVTAAHRDDDPLKDLPEEARQSVEEFLNYVRAKYKKTGE